MKPKAQNLVSMSYQHAKAHLFALKMRRNLSAWVEPMDVLLLAAENKKTLEEKKI